MKKIIIILFFCAVCKATIAQASVKMLAASDSSLSEYLSNRIEYETITDSCFSTFFFIKFSLSKKGILTDFEISLNAPSVIQKIFEEQLKALNGHWDKKFIKTFHNDLLCLPIWMDISNECSRKDTTDFYYQNQKTNKITLEAFNGTYKGKYLLSSSTVARLVDEICKIQEGLKKSLIFRACLNFFQ
jgi:hypothetical protein